jgi:hypothetical protein
MYCVSDMSGELHCLGSIVFVAVFITIAKLHPRVMPFTCRQTAHNNANFTLS